MIKLIKGNRYKNRDPEKKEEIAQLIAEGWRVQEERTYLSSVEMYGGRAAEVSAQVEGTRKVDLVKHSVSQGVYGLDMDSK